MDYLRFPPLPILEHPRLFDPNPIVRVLRIFTIITLIYFMNQLQQWVLNMILVPVMFIAKISPTTLVYETGALLVHDLLETLTYLVSLPRAIVDFSLPNISTVLSSSCRIIVVKGFDLTTRGRNNASHALVSGYIITGPLLYPALRQIAVATCYALDGIAFLTYILIMCMIQSTTWLLIRGSPVFYWLVEMLADEAEFFLERRFLPITTTLIFDVVLPYLELGWLISVYCFNDIALHSATFIYRMIRISLYNLYFATYHAFLYLDSHIKHRMATLILSQGHLVLALLNPVANTLVAGMYFSAVLVAQLALFACSNIVRGLFPVVCQGWKTLSRALIHCITLSAGWAYISIQLAQSAIPRLSIVAKSALFRIVALRRDIPFSVALSFRFLKFIVRRTVDAVDWIFYFICRLLAVCYAAVVIIVVLLVRFVPVFFRRLESLASASLYCLQFLLFALAYIFERRWRSIFFILVSTGLIHVLNINRADNPDFPIFCASLLCIEMILVARRLYEVVRVLRTLGYRPQINRRTIRKYLALYCFYSWAALIIRVVAKYFSYATASVMNNVKDAIVAAQVGSMDMLLRSSLKIIEYVLMSFLLLYLVLVYLVKTAAAPDKSCFYRILLK
ncbi:hypothetical protein BCR43DRAFT_515985 [Syncephalastrum racemosum]|uniref:Uncharacterized protein n=1 Tax=Syncephalastrum racemosum TaxID=13706 RepID=A0A1X2HCI2_SYNRA|nr:hypothetical protein BCR43DRAFT_515985 [Syncephalastrum racemosum]